MESIVKNSLALKELRNTPYFQKFTNFDDDGKQRFLSAVYGRLVRLEGLRDLTTEERVFAELLVEGVGVAGVMELESIAESSGTYSWMRGYSAFDMIREANQIMNGSHKGRPKTVLATNREYYDDLKKRFG